MTVIWWARRDLRLGDNPALCAAASAGEVVPLVVVDPRLTAHGKPRESWYAATVLDLDSRLKNGLCLRSGNPVDEVVALARTTKATAVYVTREITPFGARRDRAVAAALADIDVEWVEHGSPYAMEPGDVTKPDGEPYRVFSAFQRAWHDNDLPRPQRTPSNLRWADAPAPSTSAKVRKSLTKLVDACTIELPPAGEEAATGAWKKFVADRLSEYAGDRDRPDLDTTSRMSPYLKVGAIHPRTLITDLDGTDGKDAQKYVSEVIWRDFYGDVLFHNPGSAHFDLTEALKGLKYHKVGDDFAAWKRGETGYPLVDAGMRQLLAEGWMHNRVRMVTASFLAKDLHVWWPHGAKHFMDYLIDGDMASNSHGWQWVAGTGTDAAPYFRVFNPVLQSAKFDPNGDYVRRYIPELRHLSGSTALEPWKDDAGYSHRYPERIVDHFEERDETLARYEANKK